MSRELPWLKTLGVKLGGLTLTLLIVSLLLIGSNLFLLASIRGDSATINRFGQGRTHCYRLLSVCWWLVDAAPGVERERLQEKLGQIVAADLIAQLEQQGERVLGNRVGAVLGHVRYEDPPFRCCAHIDDIHPDIADDNHSFVQNTLENVGQGIRACQEFHLPHDQESVVPLV